MPAVNWNEFERLPGAPDRNFEQLCRGLIRRNYGWHGEFAATANQPGVEFHLRLHSDCSLGASNYWFGWQCRWYDLEQGRHIGKTRQTKIVDAIDKTHKYLPQLTDWVLWTRRTLTPKDQKWFDGLRKTTHMRLHLWTAAEVEEYLSGEAAVFRATYFGELILTPQTLEELHTRAMAPIRRRLMPEIHRPLRAERQLQRLLADPAAWNELREISRQLRAEIDVIDSAVDPWPYALTSRRTTLLAYAQQMIEALQKVSDALIHLDIDAIRAVLSKRPSGPELAVAELPRRLRSARHSGVFVVTNVLASERRARMLMSELETALSSRRFAVVAGAGCGKTALAAQLTASNGVRPAGVLLHGRDLVAGGRIDSLALPIVIQGKPVPSMDALLAALDAAGERAGRRLPLVIDGLNEAEDPRDWCRALASLAEGLPHYPYVLVVCTLRPSFANEALPVGFNQLSIPDFDEDTAECVRMYFDYFRIDDTDSDLPTELLRHPLTLRLFCEVTNPNRERMVGVAAMPGSLTTLFERYVDQAITRIAELSPKRHRHYEQDIRVALLKIGYALWECRNRNIGTNDLRERINDTQRSWGDSLVRALEEDGILVRDPRDRPFGDQPVGVVYDLLAGHLIAVALIDRLGRAELASFFSDPSAVASLQEGRPESHPLGGDILRGFVGLTPRRVPGQQVWQMVGEPFRADCLWAAAWLDGTSLDGATVNELEVLARRPIDAWSNGLFRRLFETRGVDGHPLDAIFLDRVLRPMTVAARDQHWTEWVRRSAGWLADDLRNLTAYWRTRFDRTPGDRLRARWAYWLLTTSNRSLRDLAVRALYWFGRGDPSALFDLALDSLGVNDPAVAEWVFASAHGVAMANQRPDSRFADALRAFLPALVERLLGPFATAPTDDWLVRLHTTGIVELVRRYHSAALPSGIPLQGPLPFAAAPALDPIVEGDPRRGLVERVLGMDFENYTVGRLVEDRANYDMSHGGHKGLIAEILATVWVLGWREETFGVIDRSIQAAERYDRHERPDRIERYGKKYSWAGFYAAAGRLDARDGLPDRNRLSDLGVDPSFPAATLACPWSIPVWQTTTVSDDIAWLRHEPIAIPDDFLLRREPYEDGKSWVCVRAGLNTVTEIAGRRVYGFVVAALVDPDDTDPLIAAFSEWSHPGARGLAEVPKNYYTFAGEIPWGDQFGRESEDWSFDPYFSLFPLGAHGEVKVELLAHKFAWESYHSTLNAAGTPFIPSRLFSQAFDLHGIPQSFDQVCPDGTKASMSFTAPTGFEGDVLFLREDLLHSYADGRRLIWLVWGERQLRLSSLNRSYPAEVNQIYQNGQNVWR